MSDMNWRNKEDLDLTSEDIEAMAEDGQPAEARGPQTDLPSVSAPYHCDVRQARKVTFGGNAYSPVDYTITQVSAVPS
jgi:acetaldehyde dehydrogenase (acetylating)